MTSALRAALIMIFVFIGSTVAGTIHIEAGSMKPVEVETGEIFIDTDTSGAAIFNCDDICQLSEAGQPQIPWKTATVLLPPNADIDSVTCQINNADYAAVDGVWAVSPAPPILTRDADGNEIEEWPADITIVDGRDIDIYSTNSFWPGEEVRLTSVGQLRSWKLTEIAVPLVRYNPVTGQLQQLVEMDILLNYSRKGNAKRHSAFARDAATGKRRGYGRAKKLAVNYDDAVTVYEASEEVSESLQQPASENDNETRSLSSTGTSGYVIITTNAIRANSTKLADFVAHKQSMGFTVTVIDEDDTGATEVGDPAATKLREWLQANYISMDIKYVLIIGDPQPDNDYVPMKLYPCGDRNIPTDYFYAELTADWDADGDGIIGESGEIERYFEVYVGRIPYYGVMEDLDHILQKTMDYENSTDTDWRRNVFIPLVPLDSNTSCYNLGEQIKYNLLEPRGISSGRLYRDGYGFIASEAGILPPPEFTADQYPATVWSQHDYGVVVWSTHGWAKGGSGIISSDDTPYLDDAHPATTWQGSCETAYPYYSDNVTYMLLKNGGIGTNGATRNAYYYSQTTFTNSPTAAAMGYRYAKGIAEQKSCGEALYDLKEEISSWWTHNWTLFNLYGDPSVVVMSTSDFQITPTDCFYTQRELWNTDSLESRTYTLTNNTQSALSWTASKTADWFDVVPSGGSIPAESSVNVEVTLNTSVGDLQSLGIHSDVITFTDITHNKTFLRDIECEIGPCDPLKLYLPLDETSGTTATDSSVYGNDGALGGSLTFDTYSVLGQFGNALDIDAAGTVTIPATALTAIDQQITICFWTYGDSTLPAGSNYVLTAKDISGNRVLNVHLPWTDGNVYWDAGNSGSGTYDRIYKAATEAEYKGSWRHWTFTKDASTGIMRIYLDGALWHSDTGKTRTMTGINSFSLGAAYDGILDDFRVYNRVLSAAEIGDVIAGGFAESPQPYDGFKNVSVATSLAWAIGASAVGSDVYFGTSYNAVANAGIASPQYLGRCASAEYDLPALQPNTKYYWRIDMVTPAGIIIPGKVWSFTTSNGTGSITREVWEDMDGAYIYDLTDDPAYPDSPTFIEQLSSFESPTNWSNTYGAKIHGFLIPKETGTYTFWIASDDRSELWLSSDSDPANISKIAEVAGIMPTWTNPQEWDKYASQQSAPVKLNQGVPYYIMALHKEGSGDDNLAVGWAGPGVGTEPQVIGGIYLAPYEPSINLSGPDFSTNPLEAYDAVEGYAYSGSLAGSAEALDGGDVTYTLRPLGRSGLRLPLTEHYPVRRARVMLVIIHLQ